MPPQVFLKEIEKRKAYKLISLGEIEGFLEEKGYGVKQENYEAIGAGLGADYLLVGEIAKWRKHRYYPKGAFLPGFQSYTEVEIKITLWEVQANELVYEDVDWLDIQGDYGKGHTYVSYEEVVRQLSKNLIRHLPK